MSSLYQPDEDAYPNALDSIKLLSQRDLAVRVPINFVSVAGISVSSACSISDVYDASIFSKCISNLLATGFRRFELDIYWDESRSVWSFCPVQLDRNGQSNSSTATAATSSTRSSSLYLTSATLAAARDMVEPALLEPRQTTASTSTNSTTSSKTTAISVSSTAATATPLIQVGPYSCSSSTNLDLFLNILVGFLENTENNLNATTTLLSFNIYAASTGSTTAMTPTLLPTGNSLLSSLVTANASSYLYTPTDLRQQRANLNATTSWFGVPEYVEPDAAYFEIVHQGNIYSTSDGWPSDSFVEFIREKRLLTSFGYISNEMNSYNISADLETIFPLGYLAQPHPYQLSSSGNVSSGCIYNSGSTTLSNVNNSWAVAQIQTTDPEVATQGATGLINCGFTPVLNQTLSNTTAAQSPDLYHQFVMNSIWSWNTGQPRDHNSSSNLHCAVLNATAGYWEVGSCVASHYCACRVNNEPYNWQISQDQLQYDRVDQGCPDGASFTVARTAMENDYLLSTWRSFRTSSSIDDELLFLNFNDIDFPSCWVMGQNTTCPYVETDNSARQVYIVPAVAASIVFVLTALTIFVKCAANRQNTKRRRRRGNDDHGDYEGVPA